ncbi:MAG TPA: hypothetical protein VGH38_20075 [Bryobacteraceae bacterium]
MLISVAVCEMIRVIGPIGVAWCAESLRAVSDFQVPEKFGIFCEYAAKWETIVTADIAIAVRDMGVPPPTLYRKINSSISTSGVDESRI